MSIRRLLISSSVGVGIVGFLLASEALADRHVYGWAEIYEVLGYLWMPGIALSAVFFPAGIHDGIGFIYLMGVFTAGFYALLSYLFLRYRARRGRNVVRET